ncbi:uncharacterized protein LOC107303413 isoform X2 [Oryza brachyantha]|uniref:uncharacterized protein LOC107303413 isoform X2 n=1 Tax=Oryza brachyantha TaxID=4533 RepID=UPI000776896F|nr:uncharacterized protein LOC107303413 isoform X2 [Oryza brachyantha]
MASSAAASLATASHRQRPLAGNRWQGTHGIEERGGHRRIRRGQDEQGRDQVWERAGGVSEELDPQLRAEAALARAAIGGAAQVGDQGRLHARDHASSEKAICNLERKPLMYCVFHRKIGCLNNLGVITIYYMHVFSKS